MEETFKTVIIDGIDTHYQVSDHGRVFNKTKQKFLKPRSHTSGYEQVSLYINKEEYRFYIHRLVMLTFEPDHPEEYNQVNHIDGDKTNNYLYNLEWCNNSLNQLHAHETKLKIAKKGIDAHNAKFNEKFIHKLCGYLSSGLNNYTIMKIEPKADADILYRLRNRISWTHISSEYSFPDVKNNNRGETNPFNKYSNDTVHEICKLIDIGLHNKDIVKKLNIPKDYVSRIRRGVIRTDISDNYKFRGKLVEGSTTIENRIVINLYPIL
jgi:hypothetical protein